jgi:hypothetical protein
MTCRQPNFYAGRAFQALPRFNQRRKLTLEMVLENQADQFRSISASDWFRKKESGEYQE